MRRWAFRVQLALACSLAYAVLLLLFSLTIYLLHGHHLQRDLDAALMAIGRAQAAYAAAHALPRPQLPGAGLAGPEPQAAAPYHLFSQITDDTGRLVASSTDHGPLPVDPTLLARSQEAEAFGYARAGGRQHRVFYAPFRAPDGSRYRLLVAAGTDHVEAMQRELLGQLVLVGAAALAAAAAIAWLLAGAAVRPLGWITAAAQDIAGGNLDRRIPGEAAAAEFRRLIAVLNETFARLAAAIQSQRRFVADASHELRSPLAVIKAELDVATRRPRSAEEYEQVLQSNRDELRRLIRLTDDLLLLSAGDQDAVGLRLGPVGVDQLVREAAANARAGGAARDIAIETDLQLGDRAIAADRDRLRQVLDNLIDNALRYTPPGHAVRLATAGDLHAVRISVGDEGIGIPPEELPHIFDRFYRVDRGRSRNAGGAGLGLSICKMIAEQHGGAIAVESQVARGTTFTVTLPDHGPGPAGLASAETANP